MSANQVFAFFTYVVMRMVLSGTLQGRVTNLFEPESCLMAMGLYEGQPVCYTHQNLHPLILHDTGQCEDQDHFHEFLFCIKIQQNSPRAADEVATFLAGHFAEAKQSLGGQ